MATDIREINLTDEQKRCIAELADETGRSWKEILDEQLAEATSKGIRLNWSYKDRYIEDPAKRREYFRKWLAQQTSHNPNFDDSRESIYFGPE